MINFRSLNRATGPSVEPLTLAEVKQHCRVDISDDDAYLESLVTAAREYCEDYLDRTLVHTQWRMRLDGFPYEIELPRPPMASSGTTTAVSITYTANESGATVVLPSTEYRVDRDATPGAMRTLYGGSWPSHLLDQNSVTVLWWGGYGADGSSVPRPIRHAMLMLIGAWYERRQAADSAAATEIPFGVRALLDSARWGSYQ
jgi:uncharacterized phiE125 gp8 family phage protein